MHKFPQHVAHLISISPTKRQLVTPLLFLCCLNWSNFDEDTPLPPVNSAVSDKEVPGAKLEEASAFIDLQRARDEYKVLGEGIVVAIIDTGISVAHEDFSNKQITGKSFITEEPDWQSDIQGHGTHVAGIVGASGRVHTGIAPKCQLLSIKALDKTGRTSFSIVADSLDWILANEIDRVSVVNLSLGDPGVCLQLIDKKEWPKSWGRINYLIGKLAEHRVCVVVSAGNSYFQFKKEGMSFPAIIPDCISVGALFDSDLSAERRYGDGAIAYFPKKGRITPFSQRLLLSGQESKFSTDIFAPGAPITSTGIATIRSSAVFDGTSQSAPVVSGTVALIQERYKNLNDGELPPVAWVEECLRNSAVPTEDMEEVPQHDNVPNTNKTFRTINAYNALKSIER